jgi:hypothetical protein
MKLRDVHGGPELFEHHSSLAFDMPIEISTNLPNGLSSPFTSSALILFRLALAAESWSAGGVLSVPGYRPPEFLK